MRLILITLLLSLLLLPAHARLGETEDQCVQRYGPVVNRTTSGISGLDLPMLVFAKNGYKVVTIMLNDKVCCLTILKADQTALSDNEIDLFLTANNANQKWTKQDGVSTNIVWFRDDGTQAQYDPSQHALIIVSKEYLDVKAAAQKAEDAKKTQGF